MSKPDSKRPCFESQGAVKPSLEVYVDLIFLDQFVFTIFNRYYLEKLFKEGKRAFHRIVEIENGTILSQNREVDRFNIGKGDSIPITPIVKEALKHLEAHVLKNAVGRSGTNMTSMNSLLEISTIWEKVRKEMDFPAVEFPWFGDKYIYGILSDSIYHPFHDILMLSDELAPNIKAFFEATAKHYKVRALTYSEKEASIGDIIIREFEKKLLSNQK